MSPSASPSAVRLARRAAAALTFAALGAGTLATLGAALPAAAGAQEPAAPKTQVLSINPLMLVFAGLSGEYERRTGEASTIAVGVSAWGDDGFDYASGELKFRFYPSGEALRGFSVAGTGGYAHVSEDDFWNESGDAITAGVELNYQWLLGHTRSFAMTTGIGAKRFFYVSGGDHASVGVPTLRFSIGYAF